MSSIDPTAYDSLGRIMSSGGEMTLALAMSRGYPTSQIDLIMGRKFADDYTNSGGLLAAFAIGMIAAGERANEIQRGGGTIDIAEIPVNGFLPDEEMGGTRFKWTADVTFEGASSAVTVYGYSASADIQDLLNDALEGGIGIVDNYRSKFGLSEDDTVTPLSVQFTAIERQY